MEVDRNVAIRMGAALVLAFLATSATARAGDVPGAARGAGSIASALHLPSPSQTRLANGLTVVLEEDHRAPFVAMRLAYDAGWAHDPPGKAGLAALTHRMMTMGTRHAPAESYERWLDRVGATERGWRTNTDWTSIWATVPATAVPVMLWLWSDQMGFFTADDPKLLARAAEIFKNQHSGEVDDAAYGGLGDIQRRALFPAGHPYNTSFSPAALDQLTAEDLRDFHARRFAPNDAVLVLVGDFQSADALRQIRTYFEAIAPGPEEPHPVAPAALDRGVRLEVAANVATPVVYVSWRTPAYMDTGDAELDVAARVLAGPRSSLLSWPLITGRGVATSATARNYSRALGSFFEIQAMVAPGHTPEEVLEVIDQVLASTPASASDAIIRAAAESVIVPRALDLDAAGRRADLYAQYVFLRRNAGWIENDLGRYEAVTPRDVRGAFSRWLGPERRVVVVVKPDPLAPRSGELRTTHPRAQ